jgi:histidine triad (HIT) family protein
MAGNDCLFCRMAAGEIPASMAHEDELIFAVHDINPKAPTHILLIPKRHIGSAAELRESDAPMLGRLFETGARLAREAGIADDGYRLTTNVGSAAGQSVPHLHVHLMGGRRFTWPPG